MKIQIKVKIITHRGYQIPINGIFTKVISLILNLPSRSLSKSDVFNKDSFFSIKENYLKSIGTTSNEEKDIIISQLFIHTTDLF